MSILGHYNNFFFAAHLLDIAMGFKTLRTILSSVTHNGKQVSDTCKGLKINTLYKSTGKKCTGDMAIFPYDHFYHDRIQHIFCSTLNMLSPMKL